jgi:uncharacterized protein (TIGR02646 family)
MRKQTRPPAPQVLTEHAEEWTAVWKQKLADDTSPAFPWPSVAGKTAREWILPSLRQMNQEHCSFCDSFPMSTSSKEPIEHFRPKHRNAFPELAYAWTNLYYCCEFCQSCKLSRWDDQLIAPDEPGYSFLRYFICDFTTGEICPNPRASGPDQARAVVTIRLYGLCKSARCEERLSHFEDRRAGLDQRPAHRLPFRDFLDHCTA